MKASITYIFAELPILIIVLASATVLYLWQMPLIIWITVFGGASIIWTFSQSIKYIVRSARPVGSYRSGYAFPSGHTTLMFSLSLLILPISFVTGVGLCILTAVSASARVRIGVHFVRDILGAVAISIGGIFFVQYLVSSMV